MEVIPPLNDIALMSRALELAARGAGFVNPNPQVGCVIAKDGQILAEGWHHKFGDLHAERDALSRCSSNLEGATAYVTLEPCCHHGKQPPCTEALIASGIKRVVVGSFDPNPLVSGQGIAQLRSAGIQVDLGVMERECDELNRAWLHYIKTGRPYVTMKYAMTLDGKIACYSGESKWITGEQARARVHEDRAAAAAIMVGIGTVLADDPMLTARIPGRTCHNPLRVILDANLRIPLDSAIVQSAGEVKTLIATSIIRDNEKAKRLEDAGCELLEMPGADGEVSVSGVVDELGKRGCDSLIVEGGAQIHWSLMQSGRLNRVQAYIAAKLFGGSDAPSPIAGLGVAHPDDALLLSNPIVTQLGDDLLIECEVR